MRPREASRGERWSRATNRKRIEVLQCGHGRPPVENPKTVSSLADRTPLQCGHGRPPGENDAGGQRRGARLQASMRPREASRGEPAAAGLTGARVASASMRPREASRGEQLGIDFKPQYVPRFNAATG